VGRRDDSSISETAVADGQTYEKSDRGGGFGRVLWEGVQAHSRHTAVDITDVIVLGLGGVGAWLLLPRAVELEAPGGNHS
jgi:hypothetical protein